MLGYVESVMLYIPYNKKSLVSGLSSRHTPV